MNNTVLTIISLVFYIALGTVLCHWLYGPLDFTSPIDLALIVVWPISVGIWVIGMLIVVVIILVIGVAISEFIGEWQRNRRQ